MDSKKIINKYINKPAWITVVGALLVALAAVLLILGISASNKAAEEAVAQPYHSLDMENGTYAYLEVVGISDWMYQYDEDTYYAVLDAEGYMYNILASDSTFEAMKAQYDYWMDENPEAVVPEPYRVEGIVRGNTGTIRDELADLWELTVPEYEQWFGVTLLDTTSTPGSEAGVGYYLGAVFAFIIGFCMVLICLPVNILTGKTLKSLEEQNLLERAAQQLEEGRYTVIGKDQLRLSDTMLFGKGSGAVVAYSDILWIFRHVQGSSFSRNLYLAVNTRQKSYALPLGTPRQGDPLLQQAAVAIAEKNPSVLIGYSKENQKAYKQLRQQ